MTIVFWLAVGVMFWVYVGYPLLLAVVSKLIASAGKRPVLENSELVSIIIAAHNEQNQIVERLRNIFDSAYHPHLIEVIVASDGSTDETVALANGYGDPRVRVLAFDHQRGRAMVHNDAVESANGEIVVFTDASTVFALSGLSDIVNGFADPQVGCVVGVLQFRSPECETGTPSQSLYWRYEVGIRRVEADVGLLATGTGACMALRKSLYQPLKPTEDVDFVSPLDVVKQNYRVALVPDARVTAWEIDSNSDRAEFKNRVRMTSRNFVGTVLSWGPTQWFKHPIVTLSLYTHKVLRWLTGYLALVAFLVNIFLLNEGLIYWVALAGQSAFYVGAIAGWLLEKLGHPVRYLSIVFRFCYNNVAMAQGVVKGLLGLAPASYQTE